VGDSVAPLGGREELIPVNEGDRIAQLILERISIPVVRQVEVGRCVDCPDQMIWRLADMKTLDETVRGAGGFGSTGGFAEPAQKKLKVEDGQAVAIEKNGTVEVDGKISA